MTDKPAATPRTDAAWKKQSFTAIGGVDLSEALQVSKDLEHELATAEAVVKMADKQRQTAESELAIAQSDLSHAEIIAREQLASAKAALDRCDDARMKAEQELEGLRVFKRSVDEALNSGDGSYRP